MEAIDWSWILLRVGYMLFGLILLALEKRWGFPCALSAALIKMPKDPKTFKQRLSKRMLDPNGNATFLRSILCYVFLWPVPIFFSCLSLLGFLFQQLWYLSLFLKKIFVSTLYFFYNGFRWENPVEEYKEADETKTG